MSLLTLSSLNYIKPSDLAQRLRSTASLSRDETAVIDVRGDDHIGGHIQGALNVPSNTHDWAIPELVRTLQDKKVVVFHCALSQQRGPKAALEYLRQKQSVTVEEPDEGVQQQEVFVLEGGFVKWQESYGTDKELTQDYAADIWADGY